MGLCVFAYVHILVCLECLVSLKRCNNHAFCCAHRRPQIFPDGLSFVHDHTNYTFGLHNRHFALDNVYARQNGGPWDFTCGPKACLPLQQEFWDYLIKDKVGKKGMTVYWQDFLSTATSSVEMLWTSPTLGRQWLTQMGRACSDNGVTIQYCMSYGRHVLQSVEVPAVTQIRASDDYHCNDNWKIGLSAILMWSMGLAPSKDNYRSTDHQLPMSHCNEEYSRIHSAVSSLSAGPVAPSDKIGTSNVSLIMRGVNSAGELLRPDRPLFSIDATFCQLAFGNDCGPRGVIMTTYSIMSDMTNAYVLVGELQTAYNVSTTDMDIGSDGFDAYYAYDAAATTSSPHGEWKVGVDVRGAVRSPIYPNGSKVATPEACAALCRGDCVAAVYASGDDHLPSENCWPLIGFSGTHERSGRRVFFAPHVVEQHVSKVWGCV